MAVERMMLVTAGTTLAVDGPILVDLATPDGEAWRADIQVDGLDVVAEASPWSWAPGHAPAQPAAAVVYDAEAWQALADAETLGDVRDAAGQAGV